MPRIDDGRIEEWKKKYEENILRSGVKWYLAWCRSDPRNENKCVIDEEMIEKFVSSVRGKGDEWAKNFIRGVAKEGED